MSNNEQVINFGNQKLLLLNGTAHKLDSARAIQWATEWFMKNWKSVKMIKGSPHLGMLATVNKAAADFFANSDYKGKREAICAVYEGEENEKLGIAA